MPSKSDAADDLDDFLTADEALHTDTDQYQYDDYSLLQLRPN